MVRKDFRCPHPVRNGFFLCLAHQLIGPAKDGEQKSRPSLTVVLAVAAGNLITEMPPAARPRGPPVPPLRLAL